jgi:hypothetical protein
VKEKPATPAVAIGVGLKDVSAANLRLAEIAASGTDVKMKGGRFTGDVDIRGVHAGISPRESPKRIGDVGHRR